MVIFFAVAKIRKKLLDYYNGKHVRLFYTIKQFYWIGLLFFCCWSYKRRDSISYLKLAIIGLTIFELLFEARARYLITYVPIYIIIAIQGLDIILNYINSIKKKRNI